MADNNELNVNRLLTNEDNRTDINVWDFLEEITYKKNWYAKVFDGNILSKWRAEISFEHRDLFELAIRLLQCTAQGVKHLPECDWDESTDICDNCKSFYKQDIIANPSKYDLKPIDIDANFFSNNDWIMDMDLGDSCEHPRCHCVPPHSALNNYIDHQPNGVLSKELHAECKSILNEISDKEPIDWHPGSKDQVRDIIHPSMYCYVKGISRHIDGSIGASGPENQRYQWLPSEFSVDFNGKTSVQSYINNLPMNKYPKFVPLIERVFEQFIPSLERVLHQKVRGRQLQVIVKVGNIILTPGNSTYPGGSWHIEGMPYEYIAATCIHYVQVENITDSYLEFRKPVIINEENCDYPQSDSAFTRHHYGVESHHDGTMNRYLGLIKCTEGSSIVFPNTLQHRVKDFSLTEKKLCELHPSSNRMILAFFVIDPNNRIVSTKDVPPQQTIMSLPDALHYRERLMVHRKFFINQLNEIVFLRNFSLCEH